MPMAFMVSSFFVLSVASLTTRGNMSAHIQFSELTKWRNEARSTKQESQQVFLIVSDRKRCSALAEELRADGLKVEEYQTAREFLIDKVNHQGGVVVASVRLMGLAFMLHRGRMSCSSAAGVIASESIHRGQLTRFLARPRWQKDDFNEPLRAAMLSMEFLFGRFLFIVVATLFSQAGKKTQNTYSTGNRQRRTKHGRRYNNKKVHRKTVLV